MEISASVETNSNALQILNFLPKVQQRDEWFRSWVFAERWKSDEKQPTPMLSVASSLYIALPRDHRSSTWQPGRTTEEDYLGSKAISDNLLKAKSLLALVLNPLTTSMWRLLVMRSFPGGPGFTRIFTFKKRPLFVNSIGFETYRWLCYILMPCQASHHLKEKGFYSF